MLKSDEGRTVSYWEATDTLIERDPLAEPLETDVCIIGGGIAGLTSAYLLANAGVQVAVIDDGLIGGGETCRTTAHLTNAIDDRIYNIEKWHGQEAACLAVESHTHAIDKIEQIVLAEGIDCDLLRLDGYLITDKDGEDDLDRELEAAHRAGFSAVEFAPRAPIADFDTGRCLKFPQQGQLHILKYLSGLAAAIESAGGRLFSQTRATEWTGGTRPRVVTSSGAAVSAGSVVLATNYPMRSQMFARLPAYRTYAIAFKVPKHSVETALIWDTAEPYHYVRTQPADGYDVLIVGGEDHRTGQANDGRARLARLVTWTRERYPMAKAVEDEWSGQFLETYDGLAFLGRFSDDEPNVYMITGDSGMGMTHGTIGAMVVSDLILGRDNPWAKVYDPARIATQSISKAVPELLSSSVPYTDWVTPGDVSSVDEIRKGEGAIVRRGLSKIAVYRDEDGILHERSAVCTHMGCIVRFNSLEKTWDCPCHGSRFSVEGGPLNTPAITPLETAGNGSGE